MEIINAPRLANCDFLNFRDQIFQLVDGGCNGFTLISWTVIMFPIYVFPCVW